jgi:hypothetical protein
MSDQSPVGAGHTVETVTVRTMDETVTDFSLPRVDFVMIDVEGFEGQEPQVAAKTLGFFHPTVLQKLKHWCLNAFQRTSVPDCFDSLRSMFSILLTAEGSSYKDLLDRESSCVVIYNHIWRMRCQSILAAFDEARLARFRTFFQQQSAS